MEQTFNSILRRCSGLTTGVRIEFVTADAGDKNNPQPFIMGAKMTYTTSTLVNSRQRRETLIKIRKKKAKSRYVVCHSIIQNCMLSV